MALPKPHRLKSWKTFQIVHQQGKVYKSSHLVLKALDSPQPSAQTSDLVLSEPLPPTCLGISISKKVSKKAVVRNRIKRWIKASFRTLLPQVKAGWQLIIIVRHRAIECEYEHFLRELKELLIQAEVLHGN